MYKRYMILALVLALAIPVFAQEQPLRPMTFADMFSFGRVSDPQVSPDGKFICYVVTNYNMEDNSSNSDIYRVPLAGGTPLRLTTSPKSDAHPRWSPDGTTIAFISSRTGKPQVWLMNSDGTNQRQLTFLSTGAEGVEWSPVGTHLVFASTVYPDCPDDECNRKRDEARAQSHVKARIITSLPYRVWNHWRDDKVSHVFVVPVHGGAPRDVTPGPYDSPPIDLGGHPDYAVSPDGLEIAFVRNTSSMLAASTNNDIFIVNIDGGKPVCITKSNKANDNNPVYSPDGRYIAYRAMARPGYESDKYSLMVYDRKKKVTINLTDGVDRSVAEIIWSRDGKNIFFSAEEEGYRALFQVPVNGGDVLRLLKGVVQITFVQDQTTLDLGTYRTNFQIAPDGKTFVFLGQRMNYPPEVMSMLYDGTKVTDFRQVTFTNDALLRQLDRPAPESFTFKGARNTKVQGWLLRPPGFEEGKKYPMLFLVHGGPQGAWRDYFHYRWNLLLFSSWGYVVVAINPRGSVGFGQKFTDDIRGDWGGKPYQDLMKGLDYVLKKYKFIDKKRIGAAGASYGGYMMNWFLGHTKRFKAIVSHAGVYNLVSMYGATEELWFPEWEFRGTPWTNPKMYAKWSPHRFAAKFSTPTLVSAGELDFRVPVTQSMELFTSLQRRKIPSKFLYFPDEGHLILKPQNARFWYSEVRKWFDKYLK